MTSLTQRRVNRIERSEKAVEARQANNQSLGFAPRDFVLCGLPYRRIDGIEHTRRNGKMLLRIVGDPRHGVPFGQDRLLPIWLATAFQMLGCPESNVIRFRSAADILTAFKLGTDGRQYTRLRERIERVFHATYFVEDHSRPDRISAERYQVMRRLELTISKRQKVNQWLLWDNSIELDPTFANDVRQAPVPIDLETVIALKDKPSALDLYCWQALRSHQLMRLGRATAVPLFGDTGLVAQLGTQGQQPRKLRQMLNLAQGYVKAAWPECPNYITRKNGRDVFVLRPAQAVVLKSKCKLPGVRGGPSNADKSREHDLVLIKE
ncbi:MAG: replication initiator protein A [Gammaproteobacteria bacterium]|nr:replication initiator protein A [Gammaproteobacteria bacterium]